jgi:hypothetical protein
LTQQQESLLCPLSDPRSRVHSKDKIIGRWTQANLIDARRLVCGAIFCPILDPAILWKVLVSFHKKYRHRRLSDSSVSADNERPMRSIDPSAAT